MHRSSSSHHRGWRIPAHDIEDAVLRGLANHLIKSDVIRQLLGDDHDAVMMLLVLLDELWLKIGDGA